MNDFVWIISADKQVFLGQRGVSSSYIVSRTEINGLERRLSEGTLWLVLRQNHNDRCIAAVTVKRVERFKEGYYDGDFLIYSDLFRSLRLTADFGSAKLFQTDSLTNLTLGVHALNQDVVTTFRLFVRKGVQTRLTPPPNFALNVSAIALGSEIIAKARAAVSQVVQTFNLEDIWGSGMGLKLGPVENFAVKLVSQPINDDILQIIRDLNPVGFLVGEQRTFIPGDTYEPFESRQVDVTFSEIDPETIYAREFIASNEFLGDLEAAIGKTDAAEKAHQSMLRDIVLYLKTKGIISYESTSIDLMLIANGATKIFELKSATVHNILAQAAKGAFQIASYASVLSSEYSCLEAALIIHKIDNNKLEDFARKSLDYLGVRYLIYNPDQKWPKRVDGLLD